MYVHAQCSIYAECRRYPRRLEETIRPSGTADAVVSCYMLALALGADVQCSVRSVWVLTTEHFLQPPFSLRKKMWCCF